MSSHCPCPTSLNGLAKTLSVRLYKAVRNEKESLLTVHVAVGRLSFLPCFTNVICACKRCSRL